MKQTCCCFPTDWQVPTLQHHGQQHSRLPCLSLSPTLGSDFVDSRDSSLSNQLNFCCLLFLLHSVFPTSEPIMFHDKVACQSFLMSPLAKVLGLSFSISPSNEYLWLVSFRIDWVDLLAVQRTLKSHLQQERPKGYVLALRLPYSRTLTSRLQLSSVQFIISVMFNSLWPHGLQESRPPCPPPAPRVYPNSCPLSLRCHPTISSSAVPLSSCPRYFPASGSFPMSQLLSSGGQSIGVSASTSVFQMNTQDWSP